MDEILIYNTSLLKHKTYLDEVFQILAKHQLYVKRSKCSIAMKELEYLGPMISDRGVATNPDKIVVMLQWPAPNSVTALRGFWD